MTWDWVRRGQEERRQKEDTRREEIAEGGKKATGPTARKMKEENPREKSRKTGERVKGGRDQAAAVRSLTTAAGRRPEGRVRTQREKTRGNRRETRGQTVKKTGIGERARKTRKGRGKRAQTSQPAARNLMRSLMTTSQN